MDSCRLACVSNLNRQLVLLDRCRGRKRLLRIMALQYSMLADKSLASRISFGNANSDALAVASVKAAANGKVVVTGFKF